MDKIIIQDTEASILELLTDALHLKDYKVLSITSSIDILNYIEIFKPHVVMLDFKMDGEDCIEACKLIKTKYPHLPILALSCNSSINHQYSKYGFDDYIEKPFDLEHLYSLLRAYIPRGQEVFQH